MHKAVGADYVVGGGHPLLYFQPQMQYTCGDMQKKYSIVINFFQMFKKNERFFHDLLDFTFEIHRTNGFPHGRIYNFHSCYLFKSLTDLRIRVRWETQYIRIIMHQFTKLDSVLNSIWNVLVMSNILSGDHRSHIPIFMKI